jgi:hypothetical protein
MIVTFLCLPGNEITVDFSNGNEVNKLGHCILDVNFFSVGTNFIGNFHFFVTNKYKILVRN